MKHVAIIGGGIVGLCSADALRRRGYRVTVVERDATSGDGCSFGNGGLVVPSHFEPLAAPGMVRTGLRMLRSKESPFGFAGTPSLELLLWMARFALAGTAKHVQRCSPILAELNLKSRALFEERFERISCGYTRRGELMVCRTEAGLAAEARLGEEAKHLGLKTRVLSRRELADFEPTIQFDAAGAVYFEDDAHLTPSQFMSNLRRCLETSGVNFQTGVEVTGFQQQNGRVFALLTSQGEIAADEFVLAAGSWTGRLARHLGINLPLMAGKGYGFTVANPPAKPTYPAILVDGRVAVTPMLDGLRFVGTMELGPPAKPTVNQARLSGMRKAISDFYPAFRSFDWPSVPVWAGLRPVAPDGMPYLGRLKTADNVIVAAGHGMMGLSLGPISGELVGQVAVGERPCVDLTLLDPSRFGRF